MAEEHVISFAKNREIQKLSNSTDICTRRKMTSRT